MSEILARSESLNPGELVELFIIDLNAIGFPFIFRFSPSAQLGASLWFGGNEYLPRAIQAAGFERTSNSAPPEPTLSVTNVDKGGNQLLNDYDDLLGAKVTRILTYKTFLDKIPETGLTNPSADGTAMYIPEIWYVEQKEGSNKEAVRWRLRSILDLNGKMVPGRLVLKDVCMRQYRYYDATLGHFVYSPVNACPYAGSAYFKRDGTSTTDPTLDECTKDYKGCKLRYPVEALPTWAFPGVSKLPRR